ncbi:MAG: hypothetical protein U5K79_22410 [Cyclobacteriaceae bacterium]|nr:hypothetical protein [Cyclobacteriaceae bacterium]
MKQGYKTFFKRLKLLAFLPFIFLSINSYAQCAFTNLNASYCVTDPDFTLTGGTSYFGTGVSGTTFSPSIAGVGTHQIVTTDGDRLPLIH